MLRYATGAILTATLAACPPADVPPSPGPPAPPPAPVDYIHLTTDFPSYGPGARVTLILNNPSARQYGYNLCLSRFERLEADEWVPVRPTLEEVCTLELRLIEAGGTATFPFRLDPAIPAGQYRARTSIEEMATGRRLELPSTTFAVTPRGS